MLCEKIFIQNLLQDMTRLNLFWIIPPLLDTCLRKFIFLFLITFWLLLHSLGIIENDGMLLISLSGSKTGNVCMCVHTNTHNPPNTHTYTYHFTLRDRKKKKLTLQEFKVVYYNYFIPPVLIYGGILFYLTFIGYFRDKTYFCRFINF